MKKTDDIEQQQSGLIGAIADSFARRESLRLSRLEERLGWLSRLSTYLLLAAMAYLAYQLWGEISPDLSGGLPYGGGGPTTAAVGNDDSRINVYYILAGLVGVPIVLLVGYIVIGALYNLVAGALANYIPLSRFVILPLLLLTLLNTLQSQREELKIILVDGYAMVDRQVGFGKSLSLRVHTPSASDKTLEQLERQDDEPPSPEE